MKQLEFKLITNNETVIDEKSNYFIKENILNFKAKEELYTFDLENKSKRQTCRYYITTSKFNF